jgi:hypothetical protein
MIGLASALLLSLPNPFAGLHFPHRDFHTAHYGVAGWRLDVTEDRFAGVRTCRIHRGDVRVENRVAVFRFGSSTNTANAEFRIDGGPLRSAGSVAVEAAGLGEAMSGGDLKNPSAGRVALPLRMLTSAREVSIRPAPHSKHKRFDVAGLGAAASAAAGQGCAMGPQAPPHE